ncbi:MAG: alpha/beta hydrolase domain-containing protein [Rubrivivax sp.]
MRHAAITALALALGPGAVAARIVEMTVQQVQPFAGGRAFGDAGPYERVTGVARGELDPADPRNRAIVNLAKAPRNAEGRVEYRVGFDLLRPVNGGNRKLLFDVTNRGRKFLLHWVMDGAAANANDPKTAADAGNALFLRQGWTIAWTGWDPDAPRAGGGLAIEVPAVDGVRTIREELVSGTRGPAVKAFRLAYETASTVPADTQVSVRRREGDVRVPLAPGQWSWVDRRTLRIEGEGPQPGALYEVLYPARDPRVLGIGFAATRDVVSWLRHERTKTNPAGAGVRSVIALGISQSGRYLRDHVAQGFNQDESARKVFDGVLSHIAGAGRVFLNAEFGMPARTATQHEDHLYPEHAFPFSAAKLDDPVSGRAGSLLRGDGFDPLLIEVNTSTEYWQKGASLLHTDPLGRRDVDLPPGARAYLVAGTQHGGRAGLSTARGPCANERNPHNPAPVLRALLVALDRWVNEGVAAPHSRVPTLAAKTLVAPDNADFPALPGMAVARAGNEIAPFGDWVQPVPDASKRYRTLVSATDADGNEVAGIRLPDIAVPLATYTGWNLYAPPFPEGELCDRDGSFVPFAATRAEREKAGDPRPSIEERYASHAEYLQRVKEAAAELVASRLLLQEDAAAYVERAASDAVKKRFAK